MVNLSNRCDLNKDSTKNNDLVFPLYFKDLITQEIQGILKHQKSTQNFLQQHETLVLKSSRERYK